MKTRKIIFLLISHTLLFVCGFFGGIYTLPILIAPPAPDANLIETATANVRFTANFRKDLEDSDSFHWGQGKVSITDQFIVFQGELAPGPDYRLYLSKLYLETEHAFIEHQATMVQVGEVKTFNNFLLPVSSEIDVAEYQAVIIWCETFGEFITAAKYQ